MNLDYNILNILILFGAIQGFILCFLIYQKRKTNKIATVFFILFLFSLAFYNIIYALLDMNLFKYYRPLHMFPYPYKWLIVLGFYFYIKNQVKQKNQVVFHKKEWYLFVPAIVYGITRLYWFIIAIKENSYRITQVVVDSNFFRIHEFMYLFFSIILVLKALRFIKENHTINRKKQNIKWLRTVTSVYLIVLSFNLIIYSIDLIIHNGLESNLYLYPTLIVNVLFIYWIGFIGFTKPNLIINEVKSISNFNTNFLIKEKLKHEMVINEIYKNSNLTLSELAKRIQTTTKELSNYINEVHQMNFSEFLNFHRVLKTKKLLLSPEAKKYTLISLANEAGFSSKSTFNAEFKKVTGKTPSKYRKEFLKK